MARETTTGPTPGPMSRYADIGPRHDWMFGTADGRIVYCLAFESEDRRDDHYAAVQTYGTSPQWSVMGRTVRPTTKSNVLRAMGERFPGCTVRVLYPDQQDEADAAADEADRRAEIRAWEGRRPGRP